MGQCTLLQVAGILKRKKRNEEEKRSKTKNEKRSNEKCQNATQHQSCVHVVFHTCHILWIRVNEQPKLQCCLNGIFCQDFHPRTGNVVTSTKGPQDLSGTHTSMILLLRPQSDWRFELTLYVADVRRLEAGALCGEYSIILCARLRSTELTGDYSAGF